MSWRRRDRDRVLSAILTEVAQVREALSRWQYQDAGPVHPLLRQAVAAPGRDGDLLRLEARGVEFLAVIAPGAATAESIWERAAGQAIAAGTAGRPVNGPHEVVHVAYRAFPDGLHAIGITGRSEGELLAFVSASLLPAEQRAAMRRLDRAAPRHHSVMPLAAPLPGALLLRHHPVPAALAAAAAGAGVVATVVTLQAPPASLSLRPQPGALLVTTAPPRPQPALQRRHRHRHHSRLRDNSRAGRLQRIRVVPAAVPSTHPLIPLPSQSPGGLLPPVPVPAVVPSRVCVRILHVKVCAAATQPPVPGFREGGLG